MNSDLSAAGVYTDFQGLAKLRAEARRDSPEALRAVAEQFEALFMQMMLKNMRAASFGDELFGSDQMDFYQGMFDQQLSLTLSKKQGMGLADMLVRQLGGDRSKQADPPVQPVGKELPVSAVRRFHGAVRTPPVAPASVDEAESHKPALSVEAPTDDGYASPQDFVTSLWPHAQRAATALGVAPEVLLAQAALETGWGQAILSHPDGRSSHNLFGIKADGRWQGEQVSVYTTEYQDGVLERQRAAFRAYDSPAASFADYVDFLRSSPRYREALVQAADPGAFTSALQRAGYATDPIYARKINTILDGETLNGAVSSLKGASSRPLI